MKRGRRWFLGVVEIRRDGVGVSIRFLLFRGLVVFFLGVVCIFYVFVFVFYYLYLVSSVEEIRLWECLYFVLEERVS